MNLDDTLARLERIGAEPGKTTPVAKTLSLLVRPAFIAPPKKTLVWGDFSSIEARVLPWLAGSRRADKKLDIFRANDRDPSRPDVYVATACDLIGEDAELWWARFKDKTDAHHKAAKKLRQAQGKVPELSLGFGGGEGALRAMATNYGVYLDDEAAKKMIAGWREANAWAKAFWDSLWTAVRDAVEAPGTVAQAGRVAYTFERDYLGGTLICGLPSGRTLKYPRCKWEKRPRLDKQKKPILDHNGEPEETWQLTYHKGYGRSALWYGKCLAGDTLVATNRGWVRLDSVGFHDLLWDGQEWVEHGGSLYQGVKLTIPVDGVFMTPEHKVLTHAGWREAKDTEGLHRAGVRLPDRLACGASTAARQAFGVGMPLHMRADGYAPRRWLDEARSEAIAAVVRMRNEGEDRHRAIDPALPMASEAVYDILNAGPRTRFVVLGDSGPMIVHNCAENVTQAEAGSILRGKLVILRDECEDWMPVVGHTHDEIVAEVADGDVADARATLLDVMVENDDWNEGLPLAAEISQNWFYTKALD